ncbi:copper transporter [Sphaerisporangium corydalis]|uniref:Copper transporter n=1 Tax=Sphaerisporangium corydalis TaxID=1441875 RepID=A0ABV9EWM4_9ACTN|nr:copper transporter [Sphaerisporangium corydalis]
MIDFRYHIVSIVAIFLALAVGIVLGSTVLNAPLVASTERVTAQLRANNNELHASISDLQTRAGADDTFVADRLPQLVQGALAGERVVIVEAPGADTKLRDPLSQVITAAGATVSGRVSVTEKYLTADQSGTLDQLTTSAKPGVPVFSPDATPYDKVAAVLAGAIVTSDRSQADKENPSAAGVLAAFESDGLVTLDGDPGKRATLALMVAPSLPYEGETADAQTAAVVSLASGLDEASAGTVLAGVVPVSTVSGLISAVRSSSDVAANVSTVDNVDMAFGQAVVVYALREQTAGEAGQYGLGADASAPEPSPTATATPTPTEGAGG